MLESLPNNWRMLGEDSIRDPPTQDLADAEQQQADNRKVGVMLQVVPALWDESTGMRVAQSVGI